MFRFPGVSFFLHSVHFKQFLWKGTRSAAMYASWGKTGVLQAGHWGSDCAAFHGMFGGHCVGYNAADRVIVGGWTVLTDYVAGLGNRRCFKIISNISWK